MPTPPARKKLLSASDVENKVAATGLSMNVEKPIVEPPVFNVDLAKIDDQQLSSKMGHYRAWCEYAQSLAAKAKMRFLIRQEDYKNAYNEAYLSAGGKTGDRKLVAETDTEVVRLRRLLLEEQLYMEALEGKVETYRDAIATLSREISLRDKKKPWS